MHVHVCRQQETWCTFKECRITSVMLSITWCLFQYFVFLCSDNKFSIKHALKFKYEPRHLNVKEGVPGRESIRTGAEGY
jgi:hypothetical protein